MTGFDENDIGATVFVSTSEYDELRRLKATRSVIAGACHSVGLTMSLPAFLEGTDEEYFEAIADRLKRSDVFIAICDEESTEVGIQLGIADGLKMPTILVVPAHQTLDPRLRTQHRYEVRYPTHDHLAGTLPGALRLALGAAEDARGSIDPQPPAALTQLFAVVNTRFLEDFATRPEFIRELTSRQFEELMAELLIAEGWAVELTSATRDGGYDLFAIRDPGTTASTRWVIECKKYAAHRKVGIEVVRAMYGTGPVLKGANIMLATTSYFTTGVEDFKASRYDLELQDYDDLVTWLSKHRTDRSPGTRLIEP